MSRRWMLTAIGVLWIAVLASAVAVVRARHESRTQFVQLERLYARRDALNNTTGQDQIEQGTWSNHGFVETVASQRKGMKLPKPDEIRIVAP
jgi:cell division protein FtsL